VPTSRRATTREHSTEPAPDGRAPWGSISRDQVIDAAMAVVERGEYRQMTIRRLASDLGVAPMSLYRHIRDKDDILDEVVDRLLARAWRPKEPVQDWRAWITDAAQRLLSFLVSQPAALHVYLRHPVVSPAAVERMEAMLEVLEKALDDGQRARSAYAAIHTYTVGFAALQASRQGWKAPDGSASRLAERLAAYSTSRQFLDGLSHLLDGIEADPAKKSAR
jgi:AcrR family transcriptional regulator